MQDLALRKDATQRTQRNELLHGKCKRTMYGMLLLWKMCPRRKWRHRFWTRDSFSYARWKRWIEIVEWNVRTRPRIISSQLPVLPSLIVGVLLSKVGPATTTIRSPIGARAVTIRWNDAMWLVKPCVACVKLEHWFNSWVALRALRIVKETAHYSHASLYTLTHWDDRNENAIMR